MTEIESAITFQFMEGNQAVDYQRPEQTSPKGSCKKGQNAVFCTPWCHFPGSLTRNRIDNDCALIPDQGCSDRHCDAARTPKIARY